MTEVLYSEGIETEIAMTAAAQSNPINDPNSPASSRQTWAIKCLGGGDVREQNLTRGQADHMIKQLKDAKAAKTPAAAKVKKSPFEAVIRAAVKAADKAGDEWMEAATKRGPAFRVVQRANPLDDSSPIVKDFGGMLDVCGIVYVQITDKRTAFAKWMKSQNPHGHNHSVRVPHKYRMRQEMGLMEACETAALGVLRDAGIKGVELYSRID
jgi:hypothetical protein